MPCPALDTGAAQASSWLVFFPVMYSRLCPSPVRPACPALSAGAADAYAGAQRVADVPGAVGGAYQDMRLLTVLPVHNLQVRAHSTALHTVLCLLQLLPVHLTKAEERLHSL